MKKAAVIGLGRFGHKVACALNDSSVEVIAIDRSPKLVESIRDLVTLAVCLDSTDEEALKAQGVDQVDAVIVGIGEHFEAAALTVALLKSLAVKHIIARAKSDIQAKILRKVGADEIVNPEGESALRWAHRLTLPNIREYLELGEGYSLVYMAPPDLFHDKTLKELALRNKYGVNLVAIRRHEIIKVDEKGSAATTASVVVPDAETRILADDVLVLVGANDDLSKLPRD